MRTTVKCSVVHPRQVGGRRVTVSLAEQDHKTTPKVPSQMSIVEVEAKDKGKAIGKQGRNISSIRHIAKRHHEIDEVQVV